jgi:hypothetical protein
MTLCRKEGQRHVGIATMEIFKWTIQKIGKQKGIDRYVLYNPIVQHVV